jgi:hypothetical protein
MIGQAIPISTWSWISVDTVWEVSARRSDCVSTRPNATQRSRIFWVSFTNPERSDSKDRSDVVLSWEESRYFGKAVAEDYSDANSPESEFEQN